MQAAPKVYATVREGGPGSNGQSDGMLRGWFAYMKLADI